MLKRYLVSTPTKQHWKWHIHVYVIYVSLLKSYLLPCQDSSLKLIIPGLSSIGLKTNPNVSVRVQEVGLSSKTKNWYQICRLQTLSEYKTIWDISQMKGEIQLNNKILNMIVEQVAKWLVIQYVGRSPVDSWKTKHLLTAISGLIGPPAFAIYGGPFKYQRYIGSRIPEYNIR